MVLCTHLPCSLINVFAFLFVKANSKEICEKISFPSFSSWIPIALAKVCFFHVVQTWCKQTVNQRHLRFLIFSLMVKALVRRLISSFDTFIGQDMKIFSYEQTKGGNKHIFSMEYFGGDILLQSCSEERWKQRQDHLQNVCAWQDVINWYEVTLFQLQEREYPINIALNRCQRIRGELFTS